MALCWKMMLISVPLGGGKKPPAVPPPPPTTKQPGSDLKSYPVSPREARPPNAALIHCVWQGEQAHDAAARVPGEHELSHHHDCTHLGRRWQLRRDSVHNPDRLEGLEDEEEEDEGKEQAWGVEKAGGGGRSGNHIGRRGRTGSGLPYPAPRLQGT